MSKAVYNRRKKHPPCIANAYSPQVNFGLLTHASYLELTPAAQLLCLIFQIENNRAGHNKQKTKDGRPQFSWSAEDSEFYLHISRRNHFKAVAQLKAFKFIELEKPGGLLGCNGTPNFYTLQSGWVREHPERKPTSEAVKSKMRAARKKADENAHAKRMAKEPQTIPVDDTKPVNAVAPGQPSKTHRKLLLNLYSLAISSPDAPLQPGQMVYYKRPDDRRALKAELVSLEGDVWTVIGARRAGKFARELLMIPAQYILPAETVQNATRKQHKAREYKGTQPVNTPTLRAQNEGRLCANQ